MSAVEEARRRLEIAENHFNNADLENIEAAIYELKAAELALDQRLREHTAGVAQ